MRYIQCKFGCDVLLNKGTLLVQQSNFSVVSATIGAILMKIHSSQCSLMRHKDARLVEIGY